MNIRIEKEEREKLFLSEFAVKSSESRGRVVEEEPCKVRTCFERDRDRILHSKSFRRLKHKTQVFLSPLGDHYRTRLTHTLEVSQIARTLAVALNLNENLVEAIAYGHDLGHTPFGHAGEAVLNEVCPFEFKHNVHSLRVVEKLEKQGGLNLTYEVRDGIVNHCTGYTPSTLEGKIVLLSDKIAYINHDIDDSIRAGVLKISDLPSDCISMLGETTPKRINTMIYDIIVNSKGKNDILKSKEIEEVTTKLRAFMFERVYTSKYAKEESKKAQDMLRLLYQYFVANPNMMPSEYQIKNDEETIERVVCDYIAGMTDNYAVRTFENLFIPTSIR